MVTFTVNIFFLIHFLLNQNKMWKLFLERNIIKTHVFSALVTQ